MKHLLSAFIVIALHLCSPVSPLAEAQTRRINVPHFANTVSGPGG